MITLAIETSTPRGSLAVHDGTRLLIDEQFAADRRTTATLFPLLKRVLEAGPAPEQIAVGLGPGSYAGVRIAIAAAMGVAMAKKARLVGIPSVATFSREHYVAVGDARRETFYWTEVDAGVCLDGPRLVDEAELRARLGVAGVAVFATEVLTVVPQAVAATPFAAILAELAAAGRGIVMRETLDPIYLREPHITQPKVKGTK